jgi:hypothetical protein
MTLARARQAVLAGLAFALGLAGCGAKPPSASMCQRDEQCGADACVAGRCLHRAAPPVSWSVEISPRTDDPSVGLTELPVVAADPRAFDLTAAPKTTVTGTLALDPAAAPLTAAQVVLELPSLIAGRPALQYETALVPAPSPAPATFSVAVPKPYLGGPSTLRILPTSPDDATHAPAAFSLPLAEALPLTLPSKVLTVRGRVLSAADTPLGGFIARVFANGSLVSNVVDTTGTSDADRGVFTLLVPAPADGAAGPSPTVELEPATGDAPVPHFWSKPFALTANRDFGDLHLPAYGQANGFKITAQGPGGSKEPVANAIVRAHTLLASDDTGTTDFQRDGVTDATGLTSLNLLPGSTIAKRLYEVAVVPPVGSPFATTCTELDVVAGGVTTILPLGRRLVLRGSVASADGQPVPGALVVATLTAGETATACDAFAAPQPSTATTEDDGTFTLFLDPGMYTIDVDPPAGAPVPRVTQRGVLVSPAFLPTAVTLPSGALVEGTIRDPNGSPVPLAGVRFYGPACAAPAVCPAPLEAQTHADVNGHYRAVIPVDGTP